MFSKNFEKLLQTMAGSALASRSTETSVQRPQSLAFSDRGEDFQLERHT